MTRLNRQFIGGVPMTFSRWKKSSSQLVTPMSENIISDPVPTLEEILNQSPPTVTPDTRITDVLTLMNQSQNARGTDCVLVVEAEQLVGIFTARDGVRLIADDNFKDIPIEKVMTRRVIALNESEYRDVFQVLSQLKQHQIGHLPVVSGEGKLRGLITYDTLYQSFDPAELYGTAQLLRQQVSQLQSTVHRLEKAVLAVNSLPESEKQKILGQQNQKLESQVQERTAKLQQQIDSDRLFTKIAYNIRHSLDLDEILNTTVTEIRELLQVDRVVIYRFNSDWSGVIIAESVLAGWQSILGKVICDPCFAPDWVEPYCNGRIRAVSDIYAVGMSPCHIELLETLQVRAKILVPIVLNAPDNCSSNKCKNSSSPCYLWGLLTAHQCGEPRQWQQYEIKLLQQLAVQIAIAIQQSQLYQQSQTELKQRKRMENALRDLALGVSCVSSKNILSCFALHLARILEVDCVFIGERTHYNRNQIKILAQYGRGHIREDSRIVDVSGSPCEAVIKTQKPLIIPQQVRQRFPNSQIFADLQAEGYLGVPLLNSKEQVFGIVFASSQTSISDFEFKQEILKVFAVRVAVELERQKAETSLQCLIAGTAAVTGENFFPALVRHLALALNVRYALVSEKVGDELHTLAFWSDDKLHPQFCYKISQTPCEISIEEGIYTCSSEVQKEFPQAPGLVCLNARSYLGVALLNEKQEAIGNLCIMDDQPIYDFSRHQQILTVFAARASAEMQRNSALKKLESLNHELEFIVEQRTLKLIEINSHLRKQIQERQQMEKALHKSYNILQVINEAQSQFIADADPKILFNLLLENLLALTDSEYGIIGEVFYTGQGDPYWKESHVKIKEKPHFKDYSITNIACPEEIQSLEDKKADKSVEFQNLKILFGSIIATGKPVIYNPPKNDRRRGEVPKDRPLLNSFLGIPFYGGEQKLVGGVGIANCPDDYDEDLIEYLRPFLATCANIIEANRNNRRRQEAEEALRESEAKSRLFTDITLKIRQSLELDEILQTTVREIQKILQVERVLIYQVFADGTGRVVFEEVQPEWTSILNVDFPEDVFPLESQRTYYGGRAKAVCDVTEAYGKLTPCMVDFCREWQIRAKLIVPILQENHLWGFMIAHQCSKPRKWKEFEIELLQQIAIQVGIALAQAELLKREKELSDLKSRFISMASHEFRTPLTWIASSAGIIEDYGARLKPEKTQKHFSRIQSSVQYMTQLLNDVLTISRAEAHRLECNPASIELIDLCWDLVEELQTLTTQHQIIFKAYNANSPREEIKLLPAYLDEKLLRQILSNLLSNAIKYSPEAQSIHFDLVSLDQEIIFKVQDYGIGIPPEDQARLFQSFHRANNVGTISGTGLGLAIVKNCVGFQGGEITFNSKLGEGTTFQVKLPRFFSDEKEKL